MKDKLIFFILGMFCGLVVSGGSGVVLVKWIKGDTLDIPFVSGAQPNMFNLSFENGQDENLFKTHDDAVIDVAEQHATKGSSSLMLRVKKGAKYPGMTWEAYGKDIQNWSKADAFQFDVYNNNEDFVTVQIKLKSGRKYPKKSALFKFELGPLKHTSVKIPMTDIAAKCDVKAMSYVNVFVQSPSQNYVLYFDQMGAL